MLAVERGLSDELLQLAVVFFLQNRGEGLVLENHLISRGIVLFFRVHKAGEAVIDVASHGAFECLLVEYARQTW